VFSLFGSKRARRGAADALYKAAIDAGRRPVFYTDWEVPDTLDGRFDMIALHVALICRRLSRIGRPGGALGQALFDRMFEDMDRSLRELGVGDTGVSKRVKTMAKAFFGRVDAYDKGLSGEGPGLAEAVMRNVFRSDEPPTDAAARIATYAAGLARALEDQEDEALLQGKAELDVAEPTR